MTHCKPRELIAGKAGFKIEVTEARVDSLFSAYRFYVDNPSELSLTRPYVVFALNGRATSTSSLTEIDNLVLSMKHRLDYIYTAVGGEMDLIRRIHTSADQAALDLVVDVRS